MNIYEKHCRALTAFMMLGLIWEPALQSAYAQNPKVTSDSVNSTIVTPQESRSIIINAQVVMLRLSKSILYAESADCLTNRSAAAVAVLACPTVSFDVLASHQIAADDGLDPGLETDYDVFMHGYGVSTDIMTPIPGIPYDVIDNGRLFLDQLGNLDSRALFKGKHGAPMPIGFTYPTDMRAYRFSILGPHEVLITPKNQKILLSAGLRKMEAVVEDGKWRIDFGDAGTMFVNVSSTHFDPYSKSPIALAEHVRVPNGTMANNPGAQQVGRFALAINSSLSSLQAEVSGNHIELSKLFLDNDPLLINETDSNGETVLFSAMILGRKPIVTFLLDRGANVNVRNKYGETPLDVAKSALNAGVVDLLLSHGAKTGKQL